MFNILKNVISTSLLVAVSVDWIYRLCALRERRLRWLGHACDTNGPPAHTSTGVALGGSGVQEWSRSSACKLEEHSQQGFVKDGNHLGGSRGGSSKQNRMASKCGPMHPFGCGLNQGQGRSLALKEGSRLPFTRICGFSWVPKIVIPWFIIITNTNSVWAEGGCTCPPFGVQYYKL